MGNPGKLTKVALPAVLSAISLAVAGCAHAPIYEAQLNSSLAPHAAQMPSEVVVAGASDAVPVSLDDLLTLATSRHPELRAARAKVEAAAGAMIQAGLYPNPTVGPSFKEIGNRENAWGEIGVEMSQTIVTAGKLKWAQAAAARGVTAADWQARTQWFLVATRVRLAYIELLAAQRQRDTIADIERTAVDVLKGLKTLEASGAGVRPDVIRAEVEYQLQVVRRAVADTKIVATRRALAAVVGMPEVDLSAVRGDLAKAPLTYAWDDLLDWALETSADVQEARAMVAQRDLLLQKARADATPDVTLTALPFYSNPERQWKGEFLVAAAIPIHNRNEGNIAAAKAELAQAQANEEAVALRLRERLAAAYQRFQAAQLQVDAYGKKKTGIVDKARESLKLVEVGYRGGDAKYGYTALLQAQQILFAAQLAEVEALAEWQRAAAELAGIAQLDDWRSQK
jgi:cobalt-zinc-cadmium efflux system outer membrane protein